MTAGTADPSVGGMVFDQGRPGVEPRFSIPAFRVLWYDPTASSRMGEEKPVDRSTMWPRSLSFR